MGVHLLLQMRLLGFDVAECAAYLAHFRAAAGRADSRISRAPHDECARKDTGKVFTSGNRFRCRRQWTVLGGDRVPEARCSRRRLGGRPPPPRSVRKPEAGRSCRYVMYAENRWLGPLRNSTTPSMCQSFPVVPPGGDARYCRLLVEATPTDATCAHSSSPREFDRQARVARHCGCGRGVRQPGCDRPVPVADSVGGHTRGLGVAGCSSHRQCIASAPHQ